MPRWAACGLVGGFSVGLLDGRESGLRVSGAKKDVVFGCFWFRGLGVVMYGIL